MEGIKWVAKHLLQSKSFSSFASGIAHMFACSAQHYAWLAYQHQLLTVAIDLL